MFYNTHAFVALKLYGSSDKLILIGSILPDIAITKIIRWENGLHERENAKKFRKCAEENSPSLTELYKGIMTHCILDDFTHKAYNDNVGYAYQNTEELSLIIAKDYNLDERKAKIIAHNYIESAVEILLLQEQPKIQLKIKEAIKQVDIISISDLLGLYFVINKKKLRNSLSKYFNLISKYDLKILESWVSFWEYLEKLLSLKKTNKEQKRELLNLSISLTTNTYKDFINFSISQGSKEI